MSTAEPAAGLLFVVDLSLWGPAGANRRAFLVGCLQGLDRSMGGALVVRHGSMHNRVRMIAASFLVKDLHLDWTRGARHVMRHVRR